MELSLNWSLCGRAVGLYQPLWPRGTAATAGL